MIKVWIKEINLKAYSEGRPVPVYREYEPSCVEAMILVDYYLKCVEYMNESTTSKRILLKD